MSFWFGKFLNVFFVIIRCSFKPSRSTSSSFSLLWFGLCERVCDSWKAGKREKKKIEIEIGKKSLGVPREREQTEQTSRLLEYKRKVENWWGGVEAAAATRRTTGEENENFSSSQFGGRSWTCRRHFPPSHKRTTTRKRKESLNLNNSWMTFHPNHVVSSSSWKMNQRLATENFQFSFS